MVNEAENQVENNSNVDNTQTLEEEQPKKNFYKSCDLIEHGFMVDNLNYVRVCSIINDKYDGRPIIFSDYKGELFDKDKFFAIKRKHREMMKNGTPPYECTNCPMLRENEWDDEDYIDNLLFAHWVACNSNCIYCGATTDEFIAENHTDYNFYPAIKDLIERNILIRSAKIDFAGGEPTVYPEFEDLLSLFIEKGFDDIYVNTSSIKYSPSIYEALKRNQITLTISVDAGTKEMHQKVKQVPSYDKVWNNILKYSEAQQIAQSKEKICLKYIFVPGLNDIKEEIDVFFDKVKDAKIDHVALSLDMFWWEKHKHDDNSKLIELANYFIQKAYDNNYKLNIYPWARWLLGIEQ